jgi:hypothetical protein
MELQRRRHLDWTPAAHPAKRDSAADHSRKGTALKAKMTEDNGNFSPSLLDSLRRYVPLAVWLMVALVILVIPLKIISYGYLPPDDALRHAAKAVSGKSWPEILVVGPAFKIDHNFGWHLFLRQIFLWSHCDTKGLVVFSVVALFVLLGWSALPWVKRPEAWLIALAAAALCANISGRLLLGRPFLLTTAGLLTILFSWQARGSPQPKWWLAVWFTLLIAACSFVHGVWYLWSLPVAAFFLAGQFRWGMMLAVGWLAGVFLGASFTGHPFDSLYQAVEVAQRAFSIHTTQRTLVSEFQPSSGEPFGPMILGSLLILRQLAGLNARPLTANPAFWLACLSWVLSFVAMRFMVDWGWPALMVLITCDLQLLLQARFAANSFKRLALTCGLAVLTYFVFTSDSGSRWTQTLTWTFLERSNPKLNGWLPEKGGIFYTADMSLFYQTFYKNPNANWLYIVGYEPALMPDEDFKVYHNILWNLFDVKAYKPWVDKMQPADRLVIRGDRGASPGIPQLEWNYSGVGIWVGRLPRVPPSGTPPPTIPATAIRESMTNFENSAK